MTTPSWLDRFFQAVTLTVDGGSALPQRSTLDIVGTNGTTVTSTDDPSGDVTHITIDSSSHPFTAGGDLTGTATSQTVAKFDGVTVPSNTPAIGQAIVATSSSAATWGVPLPPAKYTAFDSNHVFAWSLGDAAGTSTLTNQGSGGTATLTPTNVTFGVPWVGTPTGTVASFQTASSSKILGTSTALVMPTFPMSVEAIFSPQGTPATTRFIFEKFGVFSFYIGTDQSVNWSIVIAGTGSSNSIPGVLSPGGLYHVMMTYDGTNVSIYLNGDLNTTFAKTAALQTGATAFAIGFESNGNNDFFQGKILMTAASNIARTQAYAQGVNLRLRGWATT